MLLVSFHLFNALYMSGRLLLAVAGGMLQCLNMATERHPLHVADKPDLEHCRASASCP